MTRDDLTDAATKVPAVTLGFWVIKILAATLGETGGDTVSMSWLGETTPDAGQSGLNGYLIGTAIFGLVWLQIRARRFNPWLYWATITASTTASTTLADFATHSLGIGYPGGSLLLLGCVLASSPGIGRWAASRSIPSSDRARKPSTGSPSPCRRPSEPRSATGSPTAASAIPGLRSCSVDR